MHQYIVDTEFAVKNLFHLITAEENELAEKVKSLASVEAELKVRKWDFASSDLNDDFSDAYVMAAFGRMAKAAQQAEALQGRLAALQVSIGNHQHATQALAAAILQIAKQGISIVYGDLEKAPEIRKVGTLFVRDIIWQARNQALHYEEGTFNKWVTGLFATLEKEQGSQFSLTQHAKQTRAKQVLVALGWSGYDEYLRDAIILFP